MKSTITFLLLAIGMNIYAQKSNFDYVHGIKYVSQHALYIGSQKLNNTNVSNKKIVYEYNILAPGKIFNHGGGYSFIVGLKGSGIVQDVPVKSFSEFDYDYVNSTVDGVLSYGYGGASFYYKINRYFIGNYFDGGLYADFGLRAIVTVTNTSLDLPSSYDVDYEIDYSPIYNGYSDFLTHLSAEFKIGYAIPLNKMNISPFISVQKSLVTFIAEGDTRINNTMGFSALNFGIALTILKGKEKMF